MEIRSGIPSGFGGCVHTLEDWVQNGASRVLRLPDEGVVDGPFLRIPDGEFDTIVVSGLAESLGCVERFIATAVEHLAPDGCLILDFENLAAPRSLRFALEGRTGSLDPFGSLGEPERRLHKSRLIEAVDTAGLLLEDVALVPSAERAVGPGFVRTMFRAGFLPLPYFGGVPADRVWLRARKRASLAGSVLVGGDSGSYTEAWLREFLPANWEVIRCGRGSGSSRVSESRAFQAALPETRGETLWFLREGTRGDAALFAALQLRAAVSPTAPENGPDGDFNGLMLRRSDAFAVGGFSPEFSCDATAYEDWLLRLEASGKMIARVDGKFQGAPVHQAASPEQLVAETSALIERWREVDRDSSGHASFDDPNVRDQVAGHENPWGTGEPRVSLCMIARDEERFLAQCLESVASIVDEIIIVDTGSKDRTVEIAESFGARVVRFEWCDDFAAARNVALEAASGDWILSLDADEALRVSDREAVRSAVRDPGVAGYHLHFYNHHTSAKTAGVIMVRLFRKLPGIVWENRIHEQITTSLVRAGSKQGLQLSICDATVDHYGYLDEVMDSRDKTERNDRIFKSHLVERPDDIYMLYKYGDFLRRTKDRWSESLDYLLQAFDRLCELAPRERAELPYAGEIAALCALELSRADRDVQANRVVDFALRNFLCTPNLHYLAAGVALRGGQPDTAIGHYRRCLAFRDQVLVVPVQEGICGHVSLTGIAQAYLMKGQLDRAEQMLERSLAMDADFEPTTLVASRLHLERGDIRSALRVLAAFLEDHPTAAGVCQQAAALMKELGHTEHAKRLANQAICVLEGQSLNFEAQKIREAVLASA